MGPDALDEQVVLGEELDRLADETGDRELATSIEAFRFATCMAQGDVSQARMHHEVASRLAAELRQPAQRWLVGLMATILPLQDGRFDEAERLIDETYEAGRRA